MLIHINIGSNIHPRHEWIERAITLLRELIPGIWRRSDIIESEPWGYESDNPYLNIGLTVEPTSPLSPDELVAITRSVEIQLGSVSHRDAVGGYADRAVDIDIIAIDTAPGQSLVLDTPALALPHPRMHLREFVLRPMMQLAPTWMHPVLHLTPGQLLKKLK